MRNLFLLFAFSLSTYFLYSQTIDWKKTNNWRLYEVNSRQAFSIKSDSLKYMKSIEADHKLVKDFLAKTHPLQNGKEAVWMGAYLVSYQLADGKPRKLIVSTYGGFMFDECTKTFWELPAFLRDDWREYWEELSGRLRKSQ